MISSVLWSTACYSRCPGGWGVIRRVAEPAFGEQGPYAGGSGDPGGAQGRISDQLTETYRTYVALSETKSYRAMISEMKHYIEEHFEDPDLSLKHLSDRFQISGNTQAICLRWNTI